VVIVVFRSRIRSDADLAGIEDVALRMQQIASSMPGFISYKEFRADDKETVALVEFDSHEHLLAWRNHPEHRDAQEQGRIRVFESYDIVVCDQVRRYSFTRDKGKIEMQEPGNP
jgi:heme-degrading monooxygenase HmoA